MTTPQTTKQAAIDLLRSTLPQQADQLERIDPRLLEYYLDLRDNTSAELEDDGDLHNVYEILCAVKLLRLLRTYPVNVGRVHHVIEFYEGHWQHIRGNVWRHIDGSGGFLFSGLFGRQHYRLTPIQVFMLTGVFAAYYWFDTGFLDGDRALLPTERVDPKSGHIMDYRRLCIEAFFFIPRKFCKTTMGAFFQAYNFYWGDVNSEGYCVANAQSQSKILYDMAFDLLHQLDPKEKRIRFTATQINWRKGQERSASIEALSAGGKTKDGLFAQICSADEFGASAYVNGKSDMASLVNVIEGSMGPRRERLTIHTTTAGIVENGPCQERVLSIEAQLRRELDFASGNDTPTLNDDKYFYLLLEPDEWQRDRETVFTHPSIWKKVNPHIGLTVQPDYYDTEIDKARKDGELKAKEVTTKLFNIFDGNRVTRWLTSDQIRPRQTDRRITDCRFADGWNVFAGLDYGGTDDFWAHAYFAVNYRNPTSPVGRFFADCAAWITAAALEKSPNRPLYEKWIEQGWLRVCPGEVMEPDLAINEMMTLNRQGINLVAFGYDPAQSKQPVNTIKAWLQSLDIDAQTIKQMVVPVPQTFMTHNGLIAEIEYMLLNQEPWLYLSPSPLWPWMFGNTMVEETSASLRKVVKQSANAKVDCIHALLDALYLFDLSEGQIQA